MSTSFSLRKAQRFILDLAKPAAPETITLDNALGRVTAEALKAQLPVPSFSHSTRDGYAAKSQDLHQASLSNPTTLRVVGEIPAGCTDLPSLAREQALRIMTGAAIPPGSNLVLAQEDVEIKKNTITVNRPSPIGTFIRKKGSDLAKGKLIVRSGEILTPDHLALLATAGSNYIKVHQKPTVAVICTGSELAPQGKPPITGQVISSNRLLLDGLIRNCGSTTAALLTAPDQKKELCNKLRSLLADHIPLIITTGGMGPGKFDLMAEVFTQLGVKITYTSLKVRPGRATMLGTLAGTMIFALPGPPPAVRLLFNELIKPALRKIGGARVPLTKSLRAELSEDIDIRPGKFLNLKGGISFINEGKLQVRPASRIAIINCVISLPPKRKHFKRGERVTIQPTMHQL